MKRGPLRTFVVILSIFVATIGVSLLLQVRDSLLEKIPGLPADAPTQGAIAPDFTLETVDGATISLSDYRGQPVVVNFWATWCVPCREEMPLLQEAYETHAEDGLVIVGVNVRESPEAVKKFLQEVGADFPVMIDEDGTVVDRYIVTSLPLTFFIDRDGNLRTLVVGGMTESVLDERLQTIL
jgi:thiol-disulfide isomerase/thioredoxin